MSQNQNPSSEHPNHPVRNFFYILWCLFFSVGFGGIFVAFRFQEALGALFVPVLIAAAALVVIGFWVGVVVPVRKQKRFMRRNH